MRWASPQILAEVVEGLGKLGFSRDLALPSHDDGEALPPGYGRLCRLLSIPRRSHGTRGVVLYLAY